MAVVVMLAWWDEVQAWTGEQVAEALSVVPGRISGVSDAAGKSPVGEGLTGGLPDGTLASMSTQHTPHVGAESLARDVRLEDLQDVAQFWSEEVAELELAAKRAEEHASMARARHASARVSAAQAWNNLQTYREGRTS